MRIEHVAFNVAEPVAMADWYCKHLGFSIKRNVGGPNQTIFLSDSTGTSLVEIYCNKSADIPDYRKIHPLVVHLALSVDDLESSIENLKQSGATQFADIETTPLGDRVVFLRDPWGLAIQLCKRKVAML